MEQFPRSSSRSSRHASDQQAPHERSRANRQATEPRHAAGSHRAPANKGAHTNSAAKEQAPTRPKSRYIPALDGLRTLAVVAVVLYHLNLTWAQGGLLGVTIFFVLSGYLITRLLINEVSKTGRIDLKSFWIRRIRRLFPAVVTVVVVTCALCTIFNHVMLTKMRPDILPSLLFFNNWWQIAQNVSYFNALGDPAHRLGLNRLAGAAKHGKKAEDKPDKKADESADTALAQPSALVRFWSSPASIDVLGVVGLVGLAAMVALTNGYTAFQYRGGTLLCSILTLMVIAACVQPQGMVARALSAEPLVWVGKRSYSIYLWHYPLLLLMNPVANISDTPWWQYILQVLVVVAVAECSYRFIETPFRKGAFGRTVSELREGTTTPANWVRAHIPVCAVCGVVLVVALGGLVFVPDTSALSGEGAEILNKEAKNAKPQDQQAADDTDKDNDGFPDGSYDLLMIGDSVSLRAVDSFDGVFPHSHIDAEKGRQFDAGRTTFEGYIQQNLAGKIVVFALGTNGLVTDAQIDAIMADAGNQRTVVFVNTRSPQPWVGATNQAIANAATRYKNVRVIDWYGYSANRNDLFDGDGTHLSNAGVAEYLKLIHDAVKKDLPVHPEDHVNDPQPAAVKSAADALVNALAYKPHKLGTDK